MSGLFSAPDIPDMQVPDTPSYKPMSFEQHELLLQREAKLASDREERQRQFLLEQEEMRKQQDEAERMRIHQEERAREMELRELELAGRDVATDSTATVDTDVDDVIASMYESLMGGVEAMDDGEEGEPLPE